MAMYLKINGKVCLDTLPFIFRLFFITMLLLTAGAGLQLLEEVVALVVNEDEGGKVLNGNLPDRLHAEFGIFHTLNALDGAL